MKVVYIGENNNNRYSKLSKLTPNKIYEVLDTFDYGYYIKCDNGKILGYANYHFMTLQQMREKKLKRVLKK